MPTRLIFPTPPVDPISAPSNKHRWQWPTARPEGVFTDIKGATSVPNGVYMVEPLGTAPRSSAISRQKIYVCILPDFSG